MINKKNFDQKQEKKFFRTKSNIEAFTLEVPRYRMQCHSPVELNGFDKFERHE